MDQEPEGLLTTRIATALAVEGLLIVFQGPVLRSVNQMKEILQRYHFAKDLVMIPLARPDCPAYIRVTA
jgi:hypothetical protein